MKSAGVSVVDMIHIIDDRLHNIHVSLARTLNNTLHKNPKTMYDSGVEALHQSSRKTAPQHSRISLVIHVEYFDDPGTGVEHPVRLVRLVRLHSFQIISLF